MFNVNTEGGSSRKQPFNNPLALRDGPAVPQAPVAYLDSQPMVDLHHRLLGTYTAELDKQHDNRVLMAIDEDFYDSIQWTDEDIQTLEERGQKPLTYNVISATVDWVTGTERRSRTDFKVLPRRKTEGKPAQRKTELMKYLSDVNRSPFHVSRAFKDAVTPGVGWIEDGIRDSDEDEPLYTRYESWRNILWDSNSTEMDLSDSRYIFRTKWFDEDILAAIFAKRAGTIRMASETSDNYLGLDAYADQAMDSQEMELEGGGQSRTMQNYHGYQRRRVRAIEAWIRLPVEAQRLKGGPFHGELYDPSSRGHSSTLLAGEARLIPKVTMRMHVCIMTTAGMLWCSESPYRHNQFPFTPIWGKRRGRNNLPYGMVRGLKDIQEDVNKRAAKALWILNTNKIIMDEGAVDDVDELAEEAARADAILVKKKGYELKLENGHELSQYQLDLMSRSIAMIQQASGVTDELLGRETGAKSGIAIQRRQDQGSMATAVYFDNLRLAMQLRGEKQLANIEQFMDEEKQFRITNQRGKPEYVTVNDSLPENDIVRSKADFIISDADWHATLREAQVSALLELFQKLPPQIGLSMLDLVVESMDLANRDELVKRIRSVNGQRDPDQEEPTPEEQQQMAAKQEQDQFAKELAITQLRKVTAEAGKLEAQAEQIVAELVGIKVDTQSKAIAAATTALQSPPAVAHTADHILEASGFEGAEMPDPSQLPPPPAAMPQPAPQL